ncbi:MAG: Xaa-Pro peptidase family protein [Actinomycetota bacterium]|nr:Xaa-Pro peptidase family protein [Actinomycetota bacterium]
MNYAARIARVTARFEELGVDALLVTNLDNVSYLTGFTGTNGQVLVTKAGPVFYSDPRYAARSRALVQDAEIVMYEARLADVLRDRLSQDKIGRLGFEATTVTVAQRNDFGDRLAPAELVTTSGVVEALRRTKEPEEVRLIQEAVRIGDEAFAWVQDRIVPGATEREIALALEVHMREAGAEAVSFEPIVGSGPLSAHIHHTPSERSLGKGDLILMDFGCRLRGYCSDLTRTVVLGGASDEQRVVYESVLAAQAAGIGAVAAGAQGADVDAAARRVIEDGGHGDAFEHGLGHGVGLEIHEAPRMSRTSEDTLTAGDVVTVEPGIYIEGFGGIRIEDCVVVSADGCEVLGRAPKEDLIEL